MDQDFDQALADLDFDGDFSATLEADLALLGDTFDRAEPTVAPVQARDFDVSARADDDAYLEPAAAELPATAHDEVDLDGIDMDFSAQDLAIDEGPLPQAPFAPTETYRQPESYRAPEPHHVEAADQYDTVPTARDDRPLPAPEEEDPFGASMEDELAALLATPTAARPSSWDDPTETPSWDENVSDDRSSEQQDLEPEAAHQPVASSYSATAATAGVAGATFERAWLRPLGGQSSSTATDTFVEQPVQPYDASSSLADDEAPEWSSTEAPKGRSDQWQADAEPSPAETWDAHTEIADEADPASSYDSAPAASATQAYDPFAQLAAMARAPLEPIVRSSESRDTEAETAADTASRSASVESDRHGYDAQDQATGLSSRSCPTMTSSSISTPSMCRGSGRRR